MEGLRPLATSLRKFRFFSHFLLGCLFKKKGWEEAIGVGDSSLFIFVFGQLRVFFCGDEK